MARNGIFVRALRAGTGSIGPECGPEIQDLIPSLTYRKQLTVSQITVHVLDRQSQRADREVTTGTTAADLFAGDRDVVVARVNGQLRDLAWVLADGDDVEPVSADSADGRSVIRHSTAHVMAQAVQELFAEAKLGIGPPIENGFYYDFQVGTAFTPEDLKRIESRMRDIVKQGQRFVRREVSDEEARGELAGEPFKLELIGIKGSAGNHGPAPTTRRPLKWARAC